MYTQAKCRKAYSQIQIAMQQMAVCRKNIADRQAPETSQDHQSTCDQSISLDAGRTEGACLAKNSLRYPVRKEAVSRRPRPAKESQVPRRDEARKLETRRQNSVEKGGTAARTKTRSQKAPTHKKAKTERGKPHPRTGLCRAPGHGVKRARLYRQPQRYVQADRTPQQIRDTSAVHSIPCDTLEACGPSDQKMAKDTWAGSRFKGTFGKRMHALS